MFCFCDRSSMRKAVPTICARLSNNTLGFSYKLINLIKTFALCSIVAACVAPSNIAEIDVILDTPERNEEIVEDVEVAVLESDDTLNDSNSAKILEKRFSTEVASGEEAPLKIDSDTEKDLGVQTNKTQLEQYDLPLDGAAREKGIALSSVLVLALRNDTDFAIAAEAVNGAEIAEVNSLLAFLPAANASVVYSNVNQEVIDTDNAVFQQGQAEFQVLNASGELRQPIVDVARFLSVRVAQTENSISKAAYLATAQRVTFDATALYFNVLEAQVRLDDINTRHALLNRQIALEKRNVNLGQTVETQVFLLQVEKGNLEAERIQYLENLSDALAALGRIVGFPVKSVGASHLPRSFFKQAARSDWQEYMASAMSSNAVFKRQRLETVRQLHVYERAVASEGSPILNGFVRPEYEDRGDSRFGGGSVTFDVTAGLELRIPIFNPNGNGYRNLEELSSYRQSVIREAQVRREIETEIRSLLTRLNTLRASIDNSASAAHAAAKLVQDAKKSKNAGIATDGQILAQRIQASRAKALQKTTEFAFLRSLARLSFLTGDPGLIPGGSG